jgi:hypothetical protein
MNSAERPSFSDRLAPVGRDAARSRVAGRGPARERADRPAGVSRRLPRPARIVVPPVARPLPPPQAPPRVHLYDVLMDVDHPAFPDLGRLLWTLVATQWQWVDRRVEAVALAGERRFRRRMSVDCHVPPDVVELAADLGFDRFFVPLRVVTKRPLLAFDLRLGDTSVPLLTRQQSAMAARAVLHAAVEELGHDLTIEVVAALDQLATSDHPGGATALRMLDLDEEGIGSVRLGRTTTPADLARWAITTFDNNYLLLADVGLHEIRRRTLFKITQDIGATLKGPSHTLPWRSAISWEPTSFVFDVPDVTAATSYLFQFETPDGLMAAGGELFGATLADDPLPDDDDLAIEGESWRGEDDGRLLNGDTAAGRVPEDGDVVEIGGRRPFGAAASQGAVLGLQAHLHEVPEADTYNAEVLVRASPDGLLRASAVSACFSAVLLLLATLVANRLGERQADSSAALLLVLPGVISTYLARPGEHHLVSRLLLGVRTLTVASGMVVYTAAAVVVSDVAPGLVREIWAGLTVVATVIAIVLTVAVRRCRSVGW